MLRSNWIISIAIAQSLVACNQPKSSHAALLEEHSSPPSAPPSYQSFQAEKVACDQALDVAGIHQKGLGEGLKCTVTLRVERLASGAVATLKVRESMSRFEVAAKARQAKGNDKSGLDLQVISMGTDMHSAFSKVVICNNGKTVKELESLTLKIRELPDQDVCKSGKKFATLKKVDIDQNGNPNLATVDENGNPLLGVSE